MGGPKVTPSKDGEIDGKVERVKKTMPLQLCVEKVRGVLVEDCHKAFYTLV